MPTCWLRRTGWERTCRSPCSPATSICCAAGCLIKSVSAGVPAGLQVTLAMCLRERLSRQMQQWFNTHRHKHGRDAWAEDQEGEGMDEEGEEDEEVSKAAGKQGRKNSKGVRDAKPVPAEE
ncbi:hypothetical protein HaLaN_25601, partial [Haematococcus lacustris]